MTLSLADSCGNTPRVRYLRAMSDSETNKLLLVLVAIFLPPVAVFLKRGVGLALILNIVLCLLFVLPGMIHAIYVVLT